MKNAVSAILSNEKKLILSYEKCRFGNFLNYPMKKKRQNGFFFNIIL